MDPAYSWGLLFAAVDKYSSMHHFGKRCSFGPTWTHFRYCCATQRSTVGGVTRKMVATSSVVSKSGAVFSASAKRLSITCVIDLSSLVVPFLSAKTETLAAQGSCNPEGGGGEKFCAI